MLYEPCDFYVTRTPLLSADDYFEMFNPRSQSNLEKKLVDFFLNPVFKEVLASSSQSTYEALCRVQQRENILHPSEQLIDTLLKYYIRLTTRPTPFGLLAGVSLGKFEDTSNILLRTINYHTKRARVDMDWLYGVIQTIEADPEIRTQLMVRFNECIYEHGSHLEKNYVTVLQLNKAKNEYGTTIRYTKQVKLVRSLSKNYICFSDLIDKMLEANNTVPRDIIENFLNQLLDNEFLISDFRPPMTEINQVEYIVKKLKNISANTFAEKYIVQLETLQTLIDTYNKLQIGSGELTLKKIRDYMQHIYKSNHYLQIDLKSSAYCNSLSSDLKQELKEFVFELLKISPEYQVNEAYSAYINAFIEKYGFAAEVPVLELLDSSSGLGVPQYYNNRDVLQGAIPMPSKSQNISRLKNLIKSKTLVALRNGESTVELTKSDFDYITSDQTIIDSENPSDFIPSFELFLIVHLQNQGSNSYAFTIAPAISSNGIGNNFGRFRDMFSDLETEQFSSEFKKQKEVYSDYIFAEISEIPERGRTSNISINVDDCEYQLVLSSAEDSKKKTISVNDLYISVDNNTRNFVIRSNSLNKKILLGSTSMLNPAFGSNVFRFLREISLKYRYNPMTTLYSLLENDDIYVPRLTFKHIIIRPETWIVSKSILNWNNNDEHQFLLLFQEFKTSWKLPRYVLLNYLDNRLLLDLENQTHLYIIYKYLKSNKVQSIKLTEASYITQGYGAQDDDNHNYVTEIVVPFKAVYHTDSNQDKKPNAFTKSDIKKNSMKIHQRDLDLIPGKENWLYFKLYDNIKFRNELLSIIYKNMEILIDEKMIDQYFFIRYNDPKPHLRIRVHSSQKEATLSTLTNLMVLFEKLRKEALISTVLIDTYHREAERYGGTKLIQDAEKYFFYDSRFVLKTLDTYLGKEINLNYIAVSFLSMTMQSFGLSLTELEDILNTYAEPQAYRKEYQLTRKQYMLAINTTDKFSGMRNFPEYSKIYCDLAKLGEKQINYVNLILQEDSIGKLTNYQLNIAKSVIHMFCNRLFGNNIMEAKIYALSRHACHDLILYQRALNKST